MTFNKHAQLLNGRRVRRARFERRSSLPASASCLLANSVRESLGGVLGMPLKVRVLEPVLPEPDAWTAICTDAQIFAVRGPISDAAIVLRPKDALALAAAAFGEQPGKPRTLSAIEQEVVTRALRAICGAFFAVCGRDISALERIYEIRGFTTYLELIVEKPLNLRLGVGLSRDPITRGGATLRVEDLLDVEIEMAVEVARGALSSGALLALEPGADVPMTTRMGEPGLLTVCGSALARGQCGAVGERSAFLIEGLKTR